MIKPKKQVKSTRQKTSESVEPTTALPVPQPEPPAQAPEAASLPRKSRRRRITEWIARRHWFLKDFLGLRFIWEKMDPPADGNGYRRPVTLGIWIFTFYVALYGFTSQRYDNRMTRAEFRYNTFTTQMAANTPIDTKVLRNIGLTKIPYPPSFWNPWSILNSLLFNIRSIKYGEIEEKSLNNDRRTPITFINFNLNRWQNNIKGGYIDDTTINSLLIEDVALIKTSFNNINFFNNDLDQDKKIPYFFSENIERSFFFNSNFQEPYFFSNRLNRTFFFNCNLSKSSFSNIIIDNCKFDSSDLSGSIFRQITLIDSSFHNTDLSGTKFMEVKINLNAEELGLFFPKLQETEITVTLFSYKVSPNIHPKAKQYVVKMIASQLSSAKSLYKSELPIGVEEKLRATGFKHLFNPPPKEKK